MKIGEVNTLLVEEVRKETLILSDNEGNKIECNSENTNPEIGENINVFISTNDKGGPKATIKIPHLTLNSFEALEIVKNTSVGSFADWGLKDDLLIPFSEQDFDLTQGEKYIVFLYQDEKSGRLRGSTVFYEHTQNDKVEDLEVGQEVELLVCESSDLGITVIIDNKYEGLLYNDEVYEVLNVGDRIKGFIKKIREDNKIDVTLHKFGYRKVEPNAQKILDYLEQNDGFLDLHDKSDPEEIKHRMHMSKKTFKKALGALYKEKIIVLEKEGVRLNK